MGKHLNHKDLILYQGVAVGGANEREVRILLQ